ncbi:hypothetical protein SprV_0301189600 [Sparganum proliferum]
MLRQLLVLHPKPTALSHKSVCSLLRRISAGQLQLNHIVRHASSERSRSRHMPLVQRLLRASLTLQMAT